MFTTYVQIYKKDINEILYCVVKEKKELFCLSPNDTIADILTGNTNWERLDFSINQVPTEYELLGKLTFGEGEVQEGNNPSELFYFQIYDRKGVERGTIHNSIEMVMSSAHQLVRNILARESIDIFLDPLKLINARRKS